MTTPFSVNIKTSNYDDFDFHMNSLSGMTYLLGKTFYTPFTFTTKDGVTTGVNDHLIINGKKVPLANTLTVTTDQPLNGTYMLDWYTWTDGKGYSMTFFPNL